MEWTINKVMKYSLRKGLKKLKNVGETTVEKELNKLHTKNIFTPMNLANTREQQK